MAEVAEKLSKKDVMRYATEQLYALRPQPAGIPDMLVALQGALDVAEEEAKAEGQEGPPKDVHEAIGRIDAAVGKLEHPPKQKPDLKKLVGANNGEPQGAAVAQEAKPKK